MEVLRGNFKETLPQISASIKKADFLAIDTEFTGLINGRDVHIFDTPSEYYKSLLYGSMDFLIVQFGLCAFYWDENEKHYMNDAFNFYLYPRVNIKPPNVFMCSSSSLDFLISQGFDFNKTIRDGISYVSEPIETKLRENLKNKQASGKEQVVIPEDNKAFIEKMCTRVRTFLDEGEANEVEIDRCNSFVRMLLHQVFKKEFESKIIIETVKKDKCNSDMKVIRATSVSDESLHRQQKRDKEWEDLEDTVGFSKVARMISESRKLVVGHNMILDVLHTLNSFFHPLPDDYNEFKEFAHCMLPNLLDTKYMCYLPPFKGKVNCSALQNLLATLHEKPFSMPKVDSIPGRGYNIKEHKLHEAGFDAFVTGLCFLSMHEHLVGMRREKDVRVSPASPILKPFLNRLFLAKTATQESPCMNLTGDDPIVAREHVFLLTFPKEWKRTDINNLFTPYGGVACSFVDDTQAIVGLFNRGQRLRVMRELVSNKRVRLLPYGHYKKSTAVQLVSKSFPEGEKVQRTGTITTPKDEDDYPDSWSNEMGSVPQYRNALTNKSSSDDEAGPSTNAEASPYRVPQRPKVRCKSLQQRSPSAVVPIRKRTSSGVFEVDANEPPPKKPEVNQSETKAQAPKTNGQRKDTEKPEEMKDNIKEKKEMKRKKKIIFDKFDSKAKSKCVSAFKESDSWD